MAIVRDSVVCTTLRGSSRIGREHRSSIKDAVFVLTSERTRAAHALGCNVSSTCR